MGAEFPSSVTRVLLLIAVHLMRRDAEALAYRWRDRSQSLSAMATTGRWKNVMEGDSLQHQIRYMTVLVPVSGFLSDLHSSCPANGSI